VGCKCPHKSMLHGNATARHDVCDYRSMARVHKLACYVGGTGGMKFDKKRQQRHLHGWHGTRRTSFKTGTAEARCRSK